MKSIQASQIVDFFGIKVAYKKLDLPQVSYDFVLSYASGVFTNLVDQLHGRHLIFLVL